MPIPLDVVLSEAEPDAVECYIGEFYELRDGSIVGPMIDDGLEISFGYAAALGALSSREYWMPAGWSMRGRERDLVKRVDPPITWTGGSWVVPDGERQ